MSALRIGIAGLGTVGASTVQLLEQHAEIIEKRVGRAIQVTAVSARSKTIDRGFALDAYRWFDDPVEMTADPDIDVIVELIGGSDGIAKALVEKSLANGTTWSAHY